MTKRISQIVLIITFLGFCWLFMQVVHELGHVLGSWITGAEITKVALYPTIFSRTEIGYNPNPLFVVWAGPIVGVSVPVLLFGMFKIRSFPFVYMARFFAGFCLVANGAYIAFSPLEGSTDAGIMIFYGSPRSLLILFGILAILTGLFLWHGQGSHFGLDKAEGQVNRAATIFSVLLFIVIIAVELAVGSR